MGVALREIGRYYQPADGYVANTDIAGYALVGHRFMTFAHESAFLSLSLDATVDKYHGSSSALSQVDNAFQVTATTRNLFSFTGIAGSHSVFIDGQGLLPFNQNGLVLGYLDGTSTPTDITLEAGRYGLGNLHTLLFSSNIPAYMHRATISLTLQGTDYYGAGASPMLQWLEAGGMTWQLNQRSSFTVGIRKIVGTAPPYPVPTGAINATNLSAAFHSFQPYGEFYAAYGNPNTVSTYPAAILKYIFYLGSAKGT
jgi:hypothetical protein